MKRDHRPDPKRWKQDLYVGWVPWRFGRWWAANKFWIIAGVLLLPLAGIFLTGALGLIVVFLSSVTGFTVKVLRDRRRGIGFTRKNEIIVFGPHDPIVIPSSSIDSLGVMSVNRMLSFNLQKGDADILPDQDKWYQKMFAFAGFRSEAPIRAKDAAAAREMSLASGRGLLVVVRDKQGTFWTVSTATGYEVATLRDLAALAKVKFITPGDPFGRRPAPNRNPKRQQTKKVNRAALDHLPDRDDLRRFGVGELRSFARLRAFVMTNTAFRDGRLPEEWIPQLGLQTPDDEVMRMSRRRVRTVSAGLVLAVVMLVGVFPVAAMAKWPAMTGGVLTATWPRAYERLWTPAAGWKVSEKNEDYAAFTKVDDPEAIIRVVVIATETAESDCDTLLAASYESYVGAEATDAEPFALERRDPWQAIQINPTVSLWCGITSGEQEAGLMTAEANNISLDEAYTVLNETTTRLNI
jgi:hypothetical protein